jgi:hypothetical protein
MVMRTERGWAGHFIGGNSCRFRRNTLLQKDDKFVVVSTVGNYISPVSSKPEEIGYNRYYETMVFESDIADTKYHDADVHKEISIDSNWALGEEGLEDDNLADKMHEQVVTEITEKLIAGQL